MTTDNISWQSYLAELAQSIEWATQNDAIDVLLNESLKLTRRRLATEQNLTFMQLLTANHALSAHAIQTELLLYWASAFQWPISFISKLLNASFFSILSAVAPTNAKLTRWQRYPALLAACRLGASTVAGTGVIGTILSSCYPQLRRLPPWQQRLPGLVLTLSEQLSIAAQAQQTNLQHEFAKAILHAETELNLKLLRRLFYSRHSEQVLSDDVLSNPASSLLAQSSYARFVQLMQQDKTELLVQLNNSASASAVVLNYASKINRQKQDVTDVRHACNLIGEDALKTLLAQADLQQLCQRKMVPQHNWLVQFTQCLAEAIQLCGVIIADKPKAQLLAWCLCAPIWSNDRLYLTSLTSRKTDSLQLAYSSRSLLNGAQYFEHLLHILDHYQLSVWGTVAKQWFGYVTTNVATLSPASSRLILAWSLACNIYLAEDTAVAEKILVVSGIPKSTTIAMLQQDLAEQCNCFYPIHPTL